MVKSHHYVLTRKEKIYSAGSDEFHEHVIQREKLDPRKDNVDWIRITFEENSGGKREDIHGWTMHYESEIPLWFERQAGYYKAMLTEYFKGQIKEMYGTYRK